MPVPHDCRDGFYQSYWRRPRAYLDPGVRAGISVFHRLPGDEVSSAMGRLRDDLDDGSWAERYGDLCERPALDVGFRLAIAETYPFSGESL